MSYEINLFKKIDNKTVKETKEIIWKSNDVNALDKNTFLSFKNFVLTKIININPNFYKYDDDDHLEIRYRNEIRLYFTRNHATISIPYLWDYIDEQKKALSDVYEYLKLIKEVTNYNVYDSQTFLEINVENRDSFIENIIGSLDDEYHIERYKEENIIYYRIFFLVTIIMIIIVFVL